MDSDMIFHTRTHLGAVLKPGDTVLGFYLANSNFNNDAFETMDQSRIPEVVLARKTYPNRRKKSKARTWKLRSIVKTAGGESLEDADHIGFGREKIGVNRKGKAVAVSFFTLVPFPLSLKTLLTLSLSSLTVYQQGDQAKAEADYERFLRDIAEDPELRAEMQLFKDKNALERKEHAMDEDTDAETGDEGDDDDYPEIDVDELLDEMDNLGINDQEEVAQEGTEQ